MSFYDDFNKKVNEVKNNFSAIYEALDMVSNKIKEIQDIIADDRLSNLAFNSQKDLDVSTKKLINQISFLFEESELKIEDIDYLLNKIKRISYAIDNLKKKDKSSIELTLPLYNLFYFVIHSALSSFSLIDKGEFSIENHKNKIETYVSKAWGIDIPSLPFIVNAENIIKTLTNSYILETDTKTLELVRNTNNQLITAISKITLALTENNNFGYVKKALNKYLEELSYVKARVSLADAMKRRDAIVNKLQNIEDPSVDEFFNLLQ